MGAITLDGPSLFLQGAILLIGIVAAALIAEHRLVAFAPQGSAVPGSHDENRAAEAGFIQTEVFPLTMLSIGGMLVFVAAGDLLTMFVALEVFSLPLYVLCGLASRRRLLSQEAALKYFLLGAFASAFFLFGIAMLYGYAGTLSLSGIGEAITTGGGQRSLALIGVALLSVGLLFKVGAVPFHSWVSDVYQGAPTPITAFMAAAIKIAAFGAVLRVFYVALPGLIGDWRPVLSAAAVLSMVVAAVLTVTQRNVKRLLAYSSVTNAGFLLIGTVAANDAGLSSTLFYLIAYGFTAVGAFGLAGLVLTETGDEEADLREWTGLVAPPLRRSVRPVLACDGGDPADQWVRQQVRGVHRGDGRRGRIPGGDRSDQQRDRRVRLRQGDRGDVLLRSRGTGYHNGERAGLVGVNRDHRRRRRNRRTGNRATNRAGTGKSSRPFHPLIPCPVA
ncbi:hypothetical protein MAGR_62070 [Mycolicibacterium agri]|uniref:NADH:quinone oxidoreductase/Mrp antiporter transmembrane domain-containing protein n=1 Tax=Mycolicibacterium agri TaxID=36811 RepID=A0A7I9WC33_MYCAG|nr:hypothetical protein MAGR_62070 [Mycolicibacterium agri]